MRICQSRSRKGFAVGAPPFSTVCVARVLIILLSLQVLWADPSLASQTPSREPLGSLSTTGEVYVNGARVTGETTLFVGDSLRTGADGAASLTISGRGMLIIAKQTEVSFVPTTRYFAELRDGSVGYRSLADARNFGLRVGNFSMVPVIDTEVAADIERTPDGTTQVTCKQGSLGVISIEGPESIFLHPGEVGTISPEGRLSTAAAQAGAVPLAGAPPAVPPLQGKRKHTGWIILGVAGGGAAAAAAALATLGGKAAASPSAP